MNKKFKWYIAHIYAGFEDKVVRDIYDAAKKKNLEGCINEIYVPKEKFKKTVRGKNVVAEKNAFPGYMLLNIDLNDQLFSIIKNTPRVTNFLCASNSKPVVVSDAEVVAIKQRAEEATAKAETVDTFAENDMVKINDGAFASFNGRIKEIKDSQLKVEVTIFGRPVTVDLTTDQVERAE